MGHITKNATPMWPTRTPSRVATTAWPTSCRVLETISASMKPTMPAGVRMSSTLWVKASHWRATIVRPSSVAATSSASAIGENSGSSHGVIRANARCG